MMPSGGVHPISTPSRSDARPIHGETVYLAGQVGTPGESVSAQTKEVLAKIEDLLARSGSGKHLMLKATIWLADMTDFDEMNVVWDAWVADTDPPARAICGIRSATPTYKIEIVIIAARE